MLVVEVLKPGASWWALGVSQMWKLLVLATKWCVLKRPCLAVCSSQAVFLRESENPDSRLTPTDPGHQCSDGCVQFCDGPIHMAAALRTGRRTEPSPASLRVLSRGGLLLCSSSKLNPCALTELYGGSEKSQSNSEMLSILDSQWKLSSASLCFAGDKAEAQRRGVICPKPYN